MGTGILVGLVIERVGLHHHGKNHLDFEILSTGVNLRPRGNMVSSRDGSGSGLVRVSAGFGFSGFGFGVGFSPTVFRFGFGFGFGFWFPPVDIQWISEINYLELKLMFYNMLMIICLLRLLNLLKVES